MLDVVSRRAMSDFEDLGEKREDDNLGNIKMNILSFQQKNNLQVYLELEMKVEWTFDYLNYLELKNVKLAVIEFSNYGIIWWD